MTDDATTDAMNDVEHLPPVELIAAQADFGRWLEANSDELSEDEWGNDEALLIVGNPTGCAAVYIFDRWDAFAAWYAVVRGTTDTKAALARWWEVVPVTHETSIRRRRP